MKGNSYTRRLGVNSLSLQRIIKSSHSGEPLFRACRNPGPPQSPFPESIQVPHPQVHGLRIASAPSVSSPACPGRHHLLILSLRYHSPLLFSFSLPTYHPVPTLVQTVASFWTSVKPTNCPHASHRLGLHDTSLSLLAFLVDQLFSVTFVFQLPFLPPFLWVNCTRLCPWPSHNCNITTKQNN